ncbi:MAG: D-tyrosyl-tRNA(Tyr) deacylase [Deltaproteobacteria bacterium]|nr:D-tyrosyl-tRNA(Tyr) deacylase [Deltaproteobacteria bacterium]
MRAVVQRVATASVAVDQKTVGKIEKGLLVYLGIGEDDAQVDFDYLLKKITGLRIFADTRGNMNLSVKDIQGHILLVSQFTLYGDARKGKRPSFSTAIAPEKANVVYRSFAEAIRKEGISCEEGVFGAMMDVSSVNDGPVTILLDSQKRF